MSRPPRPARLSPPPGYVGPLPEVSPEARAAAKRAAAEFLAEFGPAPPLEVLLTPEQIAQAEAAVAAKRAAGRLAAAVAALKQAREAAGLTQQEVADRAGLAVETFGQLESGKLTNPNWVTLDRWATAVGLTPGITLTAG